MYSNYHIWESLLWTFEMFSFSQRFHIVDGQTNVSLANLMAVQHMFSRLYLQRFMFVHNYNEELRGNGKERIAKHPIYI